MTEEYSLQAKLKEIESSMVCVRCQCDLTPETKTFVVGMAMKANRSVGEDIYQGVEERIEAKLPVCGECRMYIKNDQYCDTYGMRTEELQKHIQNSLVHEIMAAKCLEEAKAETEMKKQEQPWRQPRSKKDRRNYS